MSPGQIVISKQGRDRGYSLVVVLVDGDYAYLVDGRLRLLTKPKKKKLKHLQITSQHVSLQPPCGRVLQDADIRKYLLAFEQGNEVIK